MPEETKKAASIYDGLRCLIAEQLGDRKVKLTIKSFEPCEIVGDGGRKAQGFEIGFKETPKYVQFACKTSRKQLNQIFGSEDYTTYIGKRVTLYAAQTGRGLGIRFASAEGN